MNQLAKRVITKQVMKREFSQGMFSCGCIFMVTSAVIKGNKHRYDESRFKEFWYQMGDMYFTTGNAMACVAIFI